MTTHQPNDLLTRAEVAAIFRVNARTVWRWEQTGALPAAVRTLGGHRRYRWADIQPHLVFGSGPVSR